MKQYRSFTIILILVALTIVFLSACGAGERAQNSQGMESTDSVAPTSEEQKQDGNVAEATPAQNRKIIKNAEISINVTDIEETLKSIEEKVDSAGGYISNSSFNNRNGDNRNFYVTMRVPVARFPDIMEWLQEQGKVQDKRVSTEDVTERYIDLEARINNLQAQEERLTEILDMAQTVEEVLKVEKELERIRGDLESLTGKMNYLQNRLDFSTISVSLHETVTAGAKISSPGIGSITSRSKEAFTGSTNALLRGAGNLVVFAVGILPFILPLAVIGTGIWWVRKKYLKAGNKTHA